MDAAPGSDNTNIIFLFAASIVILIDDAGFIACSSATCENYMLWFAEKHLLPTPALTAV